MTTESQSLLSEVQSTFERNGWDLGYLDSLRMQMAPGAVADAQGQQQGQQGQGQQGASANGSQAGGDGSGGQGQGGGGTQGGSSPYSLAEGFLGRIPAEHRPIVEPYVRQWDAGVTRRFQELQSQAQQYSELGDYDDLAQAAGVYQMLQENPYQLYGILHQALMNGEIQMPQGAPPLGQQQQQFGQPPQQGQQFPQGQQGAPPDQGQIGPDGIPVAVAQRLDQLTQALQAIGQHVLGQQQAQTQQQEDDQLNEWLEQQHAEFGDFDDHWFLTKVYNGSSPEDAVTEWNNLITSRAQQTLQTNSQIPALLGAGGGGGGAPADPTNVKNLSRGQTKNLVAEVLASRANQGQ